jgi:hypothetical protein
MRTMQVLALLCGVFVSSAWAQSTEPDSDAYQGKWNVRVAGSKTVMAKVSITGYGGTWQVLGKDSETNPCGGKKFPITVQESTASAFQFTAWGSSLKPACPDLTVEVKSVDASSLEGTIAPDKAVRLSRK